jgi:hypothetical protein
MKEENAEGIPLSVGVEVNGVRRNAEIKHL